MVPQGNGASCLRSFTLETLRGVALRRPDDTRCYPGHGGPFRLGDIRSVVESFVSRDHGRLSGDATWGDVGGSRAAVQFRFQQT